MHKVMFGSYPTHNIPSLACYSVQKIRNYAKDKRHASQPICIRVSAQVPKENIIRSRPKKDAMLRFRCNR